MKIKNILPTILLLLAMVCGVAIQSASARVVNPPVLPTQPSVVVSSTGSNDDVAINAAIESTATGTKLVIQGTNCSIANPIRIRRAVDIDFGCDIRLASSTINAVILGDANHDVRYSKFSFKKIIGMGSTTASVGLQFKSASFNHVIFSDITGLGKGIQFDALAAAAFENRLYGGLISDNQVGIDFTNSANLMEGNYIIATIFNSTTGLNFTAGGDSKFTEFHGVSDNSNIAGSSDLTDAVGNQFLYFYFLRESASTWLSNTYISNARDGNTYLPLRLYLNQAGTQGSKLYQGSITNWRTDGIPFVDFADTYTKANNGTYDARVQMTNTYGMRFFVDGNNANIQALTILAGGNVGVSSTNPGQKLEVAGNIGITGASNGLLINSAGAAGDSNNISFTGGRAFVGYDGSNSFLSAASGRAVVFKPNATEAARITSGGLFGVGTTTPNAAMFVRQSTAVDMFTVASSTNAVIFSVDKNAHIVSGGVAPILTSCGTSPSVSGNDHAGTITGGTGAAGCTLTFANAYVSAPHCTVTPETNSLVNAFSYVATSSGMNVAQTAFGTGKFDYICIQ